MAKLLDKIDVPADVRRLSRSELPQLAKELREFVVQMVSQTGGHFSSNLGTVELTIALHYVFDTPHDRLVWDVGHQTYPHKALTGRKDRMATLRQLGGISGFPRRDESEYDTFGTAHSSTSISAALGMAVAAKMKGESRKCVAVIGDGAMSAGMAFEALNNAGVSLADMLVVLNDNDMSISPPVGALNRYLARLMSGKFYAAARDTAKTVLKNAPPLLELARRFEEHAKGMVVPGTIFEEFGFNYVGPIDGHDLDSLIPTLENLRDLKGPQFLHVVTKKGYGYKLAEADPVGYHAASGKFDPAVGFVKPSAPAKTTFTQVFGQWLCDMAAKDERLIAITPAMREGSGMRDSRSALPERYFLRRRHRRAARQSPFAAGLAWRGHEAVVAIYFDLPAARLLTSEIHDVAIQNLPVVFALDRGGLVGADGATHAGSFDIAYLRCIPNVSVLTPADENECRQALYTAFLQDHPVAVRYPRGSGAGVAQQAEMTAIPFGSGEIRRESRRTAAQPGKRIAILAFGTLLYPALAAAERLDATVANMRFAKPLDVALVTDLARRHDAIVTVLAMIILGGTALARGRAAARIEIPVLTLGLPDTFIEHGDPAKLLAQCGLDAAGIEQSIQRRFGAPPALLRTAVGQ